MLDMQVQEQPMPIIVEQPSVDMDELNEIREKC